MGRSISDGFDGVRIINKYEYDDFDNLQSIRIGKQVSGFGTQTFRYCRNLQWIRVEEENPFFSSVDDVLFDKNQEVLICYPANRMGFQYSVPKTVKRIADFAFSGAKRLRTLELNEGLIEIMDCGLERCSNLTEIRFPQTLQGIGHVAMQGCSGIRTIHIPEALQYITFPAFPENLENITVSVDHPAYTVVDGVLYTKDLTTLLLVPANYNTEYIFIPESVRQIEAGAFSRCRKLKVIVIPKQVTSIGNFAFSHLERNAIIIVPKHLYRCDGLSLSFALCHATIKTVPD